MPDVMKTLLLNPPSFENFDGGASSRWPATREIESYWYPVWLSYPAGMIPGSRLLDASPHKINWQQTVQICKDYEFLVLFTSTVGFASDLKLLRKIKEANPSMKVAFVGPHGHIKPDETLNASEDIDFIVRGEFDHGLHAGRYVIPRDEKRLLVRLGRGRRHAVDGLYADWDTTDCRRVGPTHVLYRSNGRDPF